MFCPNCGAQNQDAATTCNKCGFNLKGSASPKFKGTMLMMNSGGATPGAPGAPPPAGGGAAPGSPALADPKPKLKGTMIGVAPPSTGPMGSPMGGPLGGAPMGGPPGGGAPMGGPQGGAPMGGPPGGSAPMGGPQGGDVNPLGGTMVANAPPGYGYGGSSPMGHPHHDAGAPATMPQAGSSSMGGAPMGGHIGAPGGMAPMAGGHMGGGHMGAPSGMAPMGAPGGAAPMGAPGGAGMAPYAPPTGTGMTGTGMTGGKLFPEKSPVAVFFLTLITCGIYAFFWYGGTKDAMEARGAEIGPIWHIFIPILGLIWVWKWCQGVEKVTNGQITATNALIRLWLLGAIGMAWLQSDFNSL